MDCLALSYLTNSSVYIKGVFFLYSVTLSEYDAKRFKLCSVKGTFSCPITTDKQPKLFAFTHDSSPFDSIN